MAKRVGPEGDPGRTKRDRCRPAKKCNTQADRAGILVFQGSTPTQPARLLHLRKLAVQLMEELAEFSPYLTGAVLNGTVAQPTRGVLNGEQGCPPGGSSAVGGRREWVSSG